MKRLESVFRMSIGFLTMLVLVCLFGTAPVKANAITITRDDGTWLWPLPANTLGEGGVQDWAGCRGTGRPCLFCETQESHWCGADSHRKYALGHSGLDLGGAYIVNAPVYATAAGKVVAYEYTTARGNTLIMEHEYINGYSYYSYYEHLSTATVPVDYNAVIPAGTQVAVTGGSGYDGNGNPYAIHLHFAIAFGPSNAVHSITELEYIEYGHQWLLTNVFAPGRILVNPASTNKLPIHDLDSGNLAKHHGSINYTCNPSEVNIGMNGTMVSTDSPWYYSGIPTTALKLNMVSNEVKWLQQALNVVMNAGLAVDGSFGYSTQNAVVAYQNYLGLEADGMFGPISLDRMLHQLAKRGYMSDGSIHNHAYTEYVSNGDGTHTAKCKECQYTEAEYTGLVCSGGTATSTTPATCAYCGGTYGDVFSIEAVKNLVAKAGDTKVDLTWSAVSGAESYAIYMKTSDGKLSLVNSNVLTNKYTVTGLANGTTVGFVVKAYGNGVWSEWSTTVWTTPKTTAVAVAPTNLKTVAGNGQVTVSWNAVPGAQVYALFLKRANGEVVLIHNRVNDTSYQVNGLANGTTVGFVVKAYVNKQWSGWSSTAWAVPQATAVAAAPKNLKTVAGNGQVTVSWDAVPGAQVYALFLKRANGEVVLIHNRVNGTSYQVNGFQNGVSVGFVVKSYVNKQWSGWSSTAWAVPMAE